MQEIPNSIQFKTIKQQDMAEDKPNVTSRGLFQRIPTLIVEDYSDTEDEVKTSKPFKRRIQICCTDEQLILSFYWTKVGKPGDEVLLVHVVTDEEGECILSISSIFALPTHSPFQETRDQSENQVGIKVSMQLRPSGQFSKFLRYG